MKVKHIIAWLVLWAVVIITASSCVFTFALIVERYNPTNWWGIPKPLMIMLSISVVVIGVWIITQADKREEQSNET